MQFSAEEKAAMLDAVGEDATINGCILPVLPMGENDHISLLSGDVVSSPPTLIASSDDVDAVGITVGESGDIITVMDKSWVIISAEPDGDGFCTMLLGVAV
jgi:hypothetical protein